MSSPSLFAVITGDVSGSSRISLQDRQSFLDHMKGLFQTVSDVWPGLLRTPFQIFRGDGFQAALARPALSLRVALVIRSGLRSGPHSVDARIAIGIGTAHFLPDGLSAEADGEAFRRSGQLLDSMTDSRLLIHSPDPDIDEEINVELGLIDTIMGRWTASQAEAVMHTLLKRNQRDVARLVNISAAAVSQRLKAAGSRSVENALGRFETIVTKRILAGGGSQ